jgi:hypothetical protein
LHQAHYPSHSKKLILNQKLENKKPETNPKLAKLSSNIITINSRSDKHFSNQSLEPSQHCDAPPAVYREARLDRMSDFAFADL